jgi:hypothetical protein
MFKLWKPGIAIVLGVMISLSLFTSGAFAQTAGPDQSGQEVYGVTATGPQQGVGTMPRQMLRHRLGYSGPVGKWRVNHWRNGYARCTRVRRYRWVRLYGRWYRQAYWVRVCRR